MIKRFIRYYRPQMKLFLADMACAFALSGCDLIFPILTKQIIDDYIPKANMKMLLIMCGVLLGAYVLKLFLNYFILYWGHLVGVGMQSEMRKDVFSHLQKLPFRFFDNNKTGSIMSRIITDLFDVSELAHHGPEDLFISIVLLAASFVLMAMMNLWLTLIIFAILPFLVWFSAKKRLQLMHTFTRTREEVAEVNATLENSISGVRVTKAYGNRHFEEERFARGNNSFVVARTKAYKVMADFHAGNTFILDLLNVVVFVAGGLFAINGKISAGDFAAYLIYVNTFLGPIRRLINFMEQYQNGMSGFKRVVEILDAEPEKDRPGASPIENVAGRITFENVTFSYEDG